MFQAFRYFTINNALRQSLDNRCFTHTRFTDKYRIIFSSSLQYLNSTPDLFITAYDRIKLALLSAFRQINSVFFQCLTFLFRSGISHLFTTTDFFDRFIQFIFHNTVLAQQITQSTAIIQRGQQKHF
eukprot:RCo053264